MKHKSLPKCEKTGKSKFKNEAVANKAQFRIWSHDPSSNIYDMHVYQCEHCHQYHIGHLSKFLKKKENETNNRLPAQNS